jgi:hypothetical protein
MIFDVNMEQFEQHLKCFLEAKILLANFRKSIECSIIIEQQTDK